LIMFSNFLVLVGSLIPPLSFFLFCSLIFVIVFHPVLCELLPNVL
jgi:hypothetical protein